MTTATTLSNLLPVPTDFDELFKLFSKEELSPFGEDIDYKPPKAPSINHTVDATHAISKQVLFPSAPATLPLTTSSASRSSSSTSKKRPFKEVEHKEPQATNAVSTAEATGALSSSILISKPSPRCPKKSFTSKKIKPLSTEDSEATAKITQQVSALKPDRIKSWGPHKPVLLALSREPGMDKQTFIKRVQTLTNSNASPGAILKQAEKLAIHLPGPKNSCKLIGHQSYVHWNAKNVKILLDVAKEKTHLPEITLELRTILKTPKLQEASIAKQLKKHGISATQGGGWQSRYLPILQKIADEHKKITEQALTDITVTEQIRDQLFHETGILFTLYTIKKRLQECIITD